MHTDTHEDPATFDGYRRLLAAVLCRAWEDAHGRNEYERAAALAWLHGDGAAALCDWLGLPVDKLRRRVGYKTLHALPEESAEILT